MDKHVKLGKQGAAKGLGARLMLAAIGGLAGMVAGNFGHYHPDKQTPGRRSRVGSHIKPMSKRSKIRWNTMTGWEKFSERKRKGRGRSYTGAYGLALQNHFDSLGIKWNNKCINGRI